MYEASVPVFQHFLGSLSRLLKKAEAHCEAKKIDPNALLQARLYPDMFPLMRQVQIACDFAKGAAARLAGVEVPSFADEEKTFADLQARIAKTLDFVGSMKKEKFADAATRAVSLKLGGQDMSFKGAEYLARVVLPNFYFHLTTAYDILRHNGLELGKRDYMGQT
jgi:uncharacterized protein